MATERRKQIADYLARYRHGYRAWADEIPVLPFLRVVFVETAIANVGGYTETACS